MEPNSSSLVSIRQALRSTGSTTITGSKLRELIVRVAPEVDIRAAVGIPSGPGALSAFVSRFLAADLFEAGRQGVDKVYRIAGNEGPTDVGAAVVSNDNVSNAWRTFASPSSNQRVLVNSATGKLWTAPAGDTSAESSVINSVTVEDFRLMMTDFTETLPESVSVTLAERAPNNCTHWTWSAALKEVDRPAFGAWLTFRHRRLMDLFDQRLAELQLTPQATIVAKNELRAAYQGSRRSALTRGAVPNSVNADARDADTQEARTSTLRRLAEAAIKVMTEDELREIRVPLGVVADAVSKHFKPKD